MMNNGLIVELLDALTGRISIKNCRETGDLSDITGLWQMISGGKNCGSGKFLPGAVPPGESREILLSLELPVVVPGEEPVLEITFQHRENNTPAGSFSFPLPVLMYKPAPDRAKGGRFTTGVRFDVSQAMISGGKVSAVITAGGMRELRYKGEHLLAETPRIALWEYGCEDDPRIAALALDRIRITPDRFAAAGNMVECHALALPRQMELDELEFTQRFVPLTSGAIRYEVEFIVPESFAGVPRLGVELAAMPEQKICIVSPDENMAEFVALTAANGSGLLIVSAGYPVKISRLPFSEYALSDDPQPQADGKHHLTIDCRRSKDLPIGAGRFRMAMIFAALDPGEEPAAKAEKLKFGE